MLKPTITVGGLVAALRSLDQSTPVYLWMNGEAYPLDIDSFQCDFRENLDDRESWEDGRKPVVVLDVDGLVTRGPTMTDRPF